MPPPYFDCHVLLVAAFAAESLTHPQLYQRALERLGCRTATLDLDRGPGWLSRLCGRAALQHRLAHAAQSPLDLVLVLDDLPLDAETLADARRDSHAKWIFWAAGELDGDRMSTLQRMAPAFDAVFVSGTDAASALGVPGLPHAAYLPAGCDPSVHRPMRARDQFRANVVFVGRATPRREGLLAELVEFGLALWGPGWRRTSLRDYCRGEYLRLSDYVRAYAGASVAVNIHLDGSPAGGGGCNRRLFELAAIGVPQVTDVRADLPLNFEPDAEVLVYRNAGELRELVRAALQDPAAAEAIAVAGRRRALGEHTLMHRMVALLGHAV
jgi:spore maturation protein CgeB